MNLKLPITIVCSGETHNANKSLFEAFWRSVNDPRPIPTLLVDDRVTIPYTFDWTCGGDPRLAIQAIASLLEKRGPSEIRFDIKELRRCRQSIANVLAALDRLEEVAERF